MSTDKTIVKLPNNINPSNVVTENIRLEPLCFVAGAFDYFGLEEEIDFMIGKTGSHVKIGNGALAKGLVMQSLFIPFQSLYNTEEFYENRDVKALFNNPEITKEDFNRVNLARMLDEVALQGSQQLFTRCARKILKQLDIDVTTIHLDSTSFHYHGQTRDDGGPVQLDLGYSRDNHPELNQVNEVMAVESFSKIPLFQICISGHVHDNTSFFYTIVDWMPMLKESFNDLKYLVADSALCTEKILEQAAAKEILVVTRVPDKLIIAKECFAKAKDGSFTVIDKDDPLSARAMWCDNRKIGNQELKLLLVKNPSREASKRKTIMKAATKEMEKLIQEVKKLYTKPCKCKADAELAIKKLQKKAKYCNIDNIIYTEEQGFAGRGRPKKDASMQTIAVTVTADVVIDSDVVDKAVADSLLYVIGTTDIERNWTMEELISVYHRQSAVERGWRNIKDPKILVSSLFLKSPTRITALMWLMTLGLLVYSAMEYKVRQVMQDNDIQLPTPDKRSSTNKPTMIRLLTYLSRMFVDLRIITIDDKHYVGIQGIPKPLEQLLEHLPKQWGYYYTADAYLE